jgi:hypothetical protein
MSAPLKYLNRLFNETLLRKKNNKCTEYLCSHEFKKKEQPMEKLKLLISSPYCVNEEMTSIYRCTHCTGCVTQDLCAWN